MDLSEDITHQENLSETNVSVAAPIEQTGETITMKISNQKDPKETIAPNLNQMMTDGSDFDEIESLYEDIEFDDESAVVYDLDYTHSV